MQDGIFLYKISNFFWHGEYKQDFFCKYSLHTNKPTNVFGQQLKKYLFLCVNLSEKRWKYSRQSIYI